MNKTNLHQIFKSYINNFQTINNAYNDENYKWEIAQEFQKFDTESDDFVDMLKRMHKASKNIIDSQQTPFRALIDYATNFDEAETVRDMFRTLYSDELLSVTEKQTRINYFLLKSEELRLKHKPNSHMYIATQGTAMQLLFLRYPNSNYGYKASQAKSFADCIEFYDDWGPMSNFKIDVYYQMCDEVIAEIKNCKALLETHKSRFEDTDRDFHNDKELHILLLDIIYSSQAYNFYDGISFSPITAQSRKLYFENVSKAKEFEKELKKAQSDADLLQEGIDYISSSVTVGMKINHISFGEGIIRVVNDSIVDVYFPKIDEVKKIGIDVALLKNIISIDNMEITKNIIKYVNVFRRKSDINNKLIRSTQNMQPYLEYLD